MFLVLYILVDSTQMITKTLKMIILINPIDKLWYEIDSINCQSFISSLWIQIQNYISNSIVKNKGRSELKSTTKIYFRNQESR